MRKKLKTKEQIEKKIESLKTDFIENLAFDNGKRELFAIVYRTLKWVLKDNQENIDIESEVKNEFNQKER